jgi:hypothetical protein
MPLARSVLAEKCRLFSAFCSGICGKNERLLQIKTACCGRPGKMAKNEIRPSPENHEPFLAVSRMAAPGGACTLGS